MYRAPRRVLAASGGDDEGGAGALFGIGGLRRVDRGELFGGHAGTGEDARALHMVRGRDHGDRIDPVGAAAFEQQRDVEDDERLAAVAAQELGLRSAHHRVHDPLELAQFGRLAENGGAELGAVEAVRPGRAGEGRLDRGERRAARPLELVDRGVGIEHGHVKPPEHGSDSRLAHADRAGQSENCHRMTCGNQ